MAYTVVRSTQEVDDTLNKAQEQEDNGGSRWPGMTYEQGVVAAIMWLTGITSEDPMAD